MDEIYGRDELDRRIGQIVDERVDAVFERRLSGMMDQLTERMAAMMGNQHDANPRRRGNPNLNPDFDEAEDDLSSVDEEGYVGLPRRRGRARVAEGDQRRWEMGMRTEIPEFHGSLQPEELLDWLATVEEILDFKNVPDDKQTKLTRVRLGKSKITSWEKMRKHLRSAFLPYNFQRIMYQRLQNLKQGNRSVDDYTSEFYQLVARNEIQETDDQLVARYIGGLKVQIQDTVNLFDPVSVSAAHQRALII